MKPKKTAIELLHKYNDLYSDKRFYKEVMLHSKEGVAQMNRTALNALRAAGNRKRAVELAQINIYGAVFVNGVPCGYIA